MADNDLVRVYRDDGSGVKLTRAEAETFVAANPTYHIEGEQPASGPTADEGEATESDLGSMTKAELVELADSKGVDSSGTKGDIIARLEGDQADEPADD